MAINTCQLKLKTKMKKLIIKLKALIYYIFNFRKINLFKKVNQKLSKKIEDRDVDRIILKGQIIKMVRNYLRVDANSLYIPKDHKNNAEIQEQINAKYSVEMQKLGIRVNNKLEFV